MINYGRGVGHSCNLGLNKNPQREHNPIEYPIGCESLMA